MCSSDLIQKLSRRHLIQRYRPESDKRSIYLKLSPEGRHQLKELETIIAKLERDAAANLTDKQLAQLILLLQKMYQ